VLAALLGADEFGFSTAPLVVEGCIMMRKCHLNTCPVGVATQDPVLRAKFTGQPEHVINYFFFVAEEVRRIMAFLGFRTVQEMIGRSDKLQPVTREHWKASRLDLTPLLHIPEISVNPVLAYVKSPGGETDDSMDHELIRLSNPALERAERVRHELPIDNTKRTVGAMLSGEIARRYGQAGLADGRHRLRRGALHGHAARRPHRVCRSRYRLARGAVEQDTVLRRLRQDQYRPPRSRRRDSRTH
jgi:hypothetical protein